MGSRTAELVRRWRSLPPLVVDGAIAGVVGVVSLVEVALSADTDDLHTGWRTVLLVAMSAVLVVRRRHPVGVWLVSGMLATIYGIAAFTDPTLPYPALIAVYTVAAHTALRMALVAGAITIAALAAALLADAADDALDWIVGMFAVTTAWLVGTNVRAARSYGAAMAARAADLERDRASATARAAAEERLRLARELHDVTAHHVSVIAVQAEAGQASLATDPERADRSFGVIADTARTALTDLRRVVGVLRDGGDVPLTPSPGLRELPGLAAEIEHAGVPVTIDVHGAPRPLGAAVDASAYRIVQEALTNVLRHAGAERAAVVVTYGEEHVALDVLDDGAGTDDGLLAGNGIVGMRERVAAFGGTLVAGERPEGGFAVHARIPTRAQS